jgi:hypothetical protein
MLSKCVTKNTNFLSDLQKENPTKKALKDRKVEIVLCQEKGSEKRINLFVG